MARYRFPGKPAKTSPVPGRRRVRTAGGVRPAREGEESCKNGLDCFYALVGESDEVGQGFLCVSISVQN